MLINTENKLAMIGLIELLKHYKRKISIILVCIFASLGISILVPLTEMKITAGGLSAPSYNTIVVLYTAMFTLALAKGIYSIETNCYPHISPVFPFTISKTVFKPFIKLKISCFNNIGFGEIINDINKDIGNISKFCNRTLSGLAKL